jgi:glycosyltransferase involved in cell wall biosynthesis
MDLGVIVATHNRPDELRRCLAALGALSREVDVIVVDSASTPPLQETVSAERWDALPTSLTILRSDEPGLSIARNLGLAACKTPFIAFIDDDAFVHSDWADRIFAAFADPAVACIGGSCLPLLEGERPRWLSDELMKYASVGSPPMPARFVRPGTGEPIGANMAFRLESLRAVPPFDPRLGRTGASLLSGEEAPVIAAIAAGNGGIWMDPAIAVDHLVRREKLERRWYWSRLWNAGVSRARLPHPWRSAGRLAVKLPFSLVSYAIRRDPVYLYRVAEAAGFVAEFSRLRVSGRRNASA